MRSVKLFADKVMPQVRRFIESLAAAVAGV